jgi:EAL domain
MRYPTTVWVINTTLSPIMPTATSPLAIVVTRPLVRLPMSVRRREKITSGIKIDRSFVQGALMDANQALITEGMIRMGKALGLRVVGEGVEETAQAQRMLALGCDAGQGYLFGRPMSREGVVEFVAQERTGARDEGSALAGGETAESLVGATGFSVGVPLVGAQITKRRDYAPRLDHELEEVSLDRLVGPPTVLDDPFIADSDDPAAMPHDLNGVGSAGGGADHSCGARDSEMS